MPEHLIPDLPEEAESDLTIRTEVCKGRRRSGDRTTKRPTTHLHQQTDAKTILTFFKKM